MAWRLRLDFYTGRDLLHSKGHVDEFESLTPLKPAARCVCVVRLDGVDAALTDASRLTLRARRRRKDVRTPLHYPSLTTVAFILLYRAFRS